jgi:hypothetical protein
LLKDNRTSAKLLPPRRRQAATATATTVTLTFEFDESIVDNSNNLLVD